MTCVLGMIVRREREIRKFVKTPFYRVIQQLDAEAAADRGRVPRRGGLPVFPVAEALQGERL